ncbi:TetR/AcrR family transcriptional regulator [Nocardia huaxiensis]|uniref:TetR/AcrR family transcriptional regulator n=1 Tax=Nocardia huaxiensis TaxID=2755382 RepID=A0A7D6VBC2_9NOCA|nr:TetR/AcrR family transcriptional regulator [Nocardia huaxiensis]QLY28837.1 TetR/AcrR family transcriptional regulator [Nocardia huaxiensis]
MPPMTRSSQPRRREKRIALEGRLLDAAETLMSEQNLTFAELSVDRLAGAAGISRASFYLYFEDKGQLLRQLAQQALTEISEAAKTWWLAAERNNPDDLQQAMKNVLATYRQRRLILSAVVEEATYDQGIAEVFNELIDGVRNTTREIIERGQAGGRIRPMPAEEIAGALTWMVERVCYQMIRNTEPENDETLAAALTQIIWNTLYLTDPAQ